MSGEPARAGEPGRDHGLLEFAEQFRRWSMPTSQRITGARRRW
jgi:hypothetical protein